MDLNETLKRVIIRCTSTTIILEMIPFQMTGRAKHHHRTQKSLYSNHFHRSWARIWCSCSWEWSAYYSPNADWLYKSVFKTMALAIGITSVCLLAMKSHELLERVWQNFQKLTIVCSSPTDYFSGSTQFSQVAKAISVLKTQRGV